MEASPLDLRSVTVIPRALLEVIPDPPVERRQQQQQQQQTTNNKQQTTNNNYNNNNNNPACINSPLLTSPPGWFVNPFGQPLTLTNKKNGATLADMLGSFWNHSGIMLESLWAYFGVSPAADDNNNNNNYSA